MRKVISMMILFVLIVLVMLCYFLFVDTDRSLWFLNNRDTLVPVGSLEYNSDKIKFLKPAYWVFLGIFGLVYLKIIWKLITFSWVSKIKSIEQKRVRG